MYELFTPRTLFEKREEIISQFKKVFGEIAADISLESEKSAASAEEGEDDSLLLDSREFNKKIFNKKKKFKPTQEEVDWVKRNDVPTTRAIIRFWILRARLKQKIRMEVTKLIDGKLQKHCLYCKASYGLQVELIQNIEDVFFQFLQQKSQAINNYDVLKWQ